MSKYTVDVWMKARREAELEVMRCTATLSGGRLPKETILEYVSRARRKQDVAIANYLEACTNLQEAALDEDL